MKHAAKFPNDRQLLGTHQDLFLARARTVDVHGRENALICKASIKDELEVSGALELFENNFVHSGASIDQCRCQNGE